MHTKGDLKCKMNNVQPLVWCIINFFVSSPVSKGIIKVHCCETISCLCCKSKSLISGCINSYSQVHWWSLQNKLPYIWIRRRKDVILIPWKQDFQTGSYVLCWKVWVKALLVLMASLPKHSDFIPTFRAFSSSF